MLSAEGAVNVEEPAGTALERGDPVVEYATETITASFPE